MLRYSESIRAYYKEILIPSYNKYEYGLIILGTLAGISFAYLATGEKTGSVFLNALLFSGFLGCYFYAKESESKRSVKQTLEKYERYCKSKAFSGKKKIKYTKPTVTAQKKAWFCMHYKTNPDEIKKIGAQIKSEWTDYKEVTTNELDNLTQKALARFFWIDYGRFTQLLAIITALISVIFLIGTSDSEPIFEAFMEVSAPKIIEFWLYIFTIYLAMIPISNIWQLICYLKDLFDLKASKYSNPDRAIKKYISDMLYVSE